MRLLIVIIIGTLLSFSAAAKSKKPRVDEDKTPAVTPITESAPALIPSVDYATVDASEAAPVTYTGKTQAENSYAAPLKVQVDGSIRIRYSIGDKPSNGQTRVGVTID